MNDFPGGPSRTVSTPIGSKCRVTEVCLVLTGRGWAEAKGVKLQVPGDPIVLLLREKAKGPSQESGGGAF